MSTGSDTQLNGSRVGLSLPGYWGILPAGSSVVAKPAGSPVINNHNKYKTHCKYGHAFSPENTGSVKGNGRYCRMCNSRNLVERYWNLKIQGFPRSQYVSGF